MVNNSIKCFLLCLVFLVALIVPASAKYILLDPAKSIVSQVIFENTTYEIRDDFNLNGSTLIVPNNCALLFKGGSVQNGSIIFRNTLLEGDVKITLSKNGNAKGHILNDVIYTRWFKGENVSLTALLNSLFIDNSHKKFIVETNDYIIKEPLIIRDLSEIVLDFNGSTLLDEIQGESVLLHRPNPMILIRSSHNIELRNFNYRISEKRYLTTNGTAVIWLGAGSNDWDKDIYNIHIHHITGKGDLIRNTKEGKSSNIFISGVGNMYNIEVDNVVYEGDVASLCNFEYGLLPADAREYKKRGINYPSYYGIHPYNLTIRNIEGKNAPNSTGYLRLSSCYNALIENCYGYNVNCFFMLYNGDMSIRRVNGSATIRNCVSYINDDYKGTSLSGLLIFNTYKDPVSMNKHTDELDHNMSYIIENCEFQGKIGLDGCGIRVLGGDGNVVMKDVTVKNYNLGAKLSGSEGKTKIGGLSFYDCLFLNNKSSIEIYSLDGCVFQGCIFRSNFAHTNSKIYNSQIAVYTGVDNFTLQNCVFENKNPGNIASFITFEQKDNVSATIANCRFVGSNTEIPVALPKTVSLNNCIIK